MTEVQDTNSEVRNGAAPDGANADASPDTENQEANQEDGRQKDGRKFVEMAPEVEARFKHTYANMKQYERIAGQMADDLRKAHDRIEKMEDERSRQSTDDRAAKLRAEEKAAMEEGDYEKASSVRDQITDLKVDSKIPKAKPKEEPKEEPWLTPEREDYMAEWAAEKDDKGGLLRPWAHPDHENHKKMVELAEEMIKKNPKMSLVNMLDHWEIEARRQNVKRPAAPVLTGASDVRPDTRKKSLSEDEKRIVKMMYPRVPAKEAEERYLKSKENLA